jgi:hypothetical protein
VAKDILGNVPDSSGLKQLYETLQKEALESGKELNLKNALPKDLPKHARAQIQALHRHALETADKVILAGDNEAAKRKEFDRLGKSHAAVEKYYFRRFVKTGMAAGSAVASAALLAWQVNSRVMSGMTLAFATHSMFQEKGPVSVKEPWNPGVDAAAYGMSMMVDGLVRQTPLPPGWQETMKEPREVFTEAFKKGSKPFFLQGITGGEMLKAASLLTALNAAAFATGVDPHTLQQIQAQLTSPSVVSRLGRKIVAEQLNEPHWEWLEDVGDPAMYSDPDIMDQIADNIEEEIGEAETEIAYIQQEIAKLESRERTWRDLLAFHGGDWKAAQLSLDNAKVVRRHFLEKQKQLREQAKLFRDKSMAARDKRIWFDLRRGILAGINVLEYTANVRAVVGK